MRITGVVKQMAYSSAADWAKQQGYTVKEDKSSGTVTITNPSTGKSVTTYSFTTASPAFTSSVTSKLGSSSGGGGGGGSSSSGTGGGTYSGGTYSGGASGGGGGTTQQKLVDFLKQYGVTATPGQGQATFTLPSGRTATYQYGQIPGTTFTGGTHYVSDPAAVLRALGLSGAGTGGGGGAGGGTPTTRQLSLRDWLATVAPGTAITTRGNVAVLNIPGVGQKEFAFGTIPGTTYTGGTHYVTSPTVLAAALGLGVLGGGAGVGAGTGAGSSLRDWAGAKGITVDWNPQTGVVTLTNPKTSSGVPASVSFVAGDPVAMASLGIEFRNGTHVVTNPQLLGSYLGITEEEELPPAEVLNRIMEYLLAQQPFQVPPQPEIVPYEPPPIEPISWEEALARAREVVEPQAEVARQRLLETYQQRRELLPYQLAARGQLGGGLLEGGMEGLTQAEARAMSELDLQRLGQAVELARAIQAGDEQRVAQELARRFNEWLAQRNLELQRWGALTESQLQAESANRARVALLISTLFQMLNTSIGIERDAIADAILRAYNTWMATGEMPDFGALGALAGAA